MVPPSIGLAEPETSRPPIMRCVLLLLLVLAGTGCQIFPEIAHQPVVHNPFPQLTKVAIAPFFNLSSEPSVDGRQFAQAYFNELQLVQGFEVAPVGVVERAMETYKLNLNNPEEVRKLCTILGVDAVVIGAVTDFSPYYPPRCAMQVEWYAANPCFQQIPPGYGLPWGTPEEEFIPGPLVLESELALARAQLRTQTPPFQPAPITLPAPDVLPPDAGDSGSGDDDGDAPGELMSHTEDVKKSKSKTKAKPAVKTVAATATTAAQAEPGVPPNYPDARAFIPAPPGAGPCACQPTNEPVLRHTRTYNGNDGEFTEALASYAFFKDEARGVGWQSYLQRSDDFIRFCCHMHIFEMLTARGGGGQTRVVWRWSADRYQYR